MAVNITVKQVQQAISQRGSDAMLAGWTERAYAKVGGFANYVRQEILTVGDVRCYCQSADLDALVADLSPDEPITIID